MRVAFFSPLPPAKSGIADYSQALIASLERLVKLETFSSPEASFDPTRFDIAVYQIGNNPFHEHAYRTALQHPGVVVLHEANLHHLIADITIKRNNWDAYLEEVQHDCGPAAFEYARDFVRTLKKGPDYEGVPMMRRLLQTSRGAIAHSNCVVDEIRRSGFTGPAARIWHGAWLVSGDRMAFRHRLGLDAMAPLVGIFGFLKPYKRIAESLRAFRRLIRVQPAAKMILVGEPHPNFPLFDLIASLGLSAHVRVLGFTPIEDFEGYLSACDIILNLRFPTVGESSGTLLRALGMAKAVLVSDIGSFREYPDEICLKVPVDASEEDHIFEYLNLLVSRPDLARTLGTRARDWVSRECSWDRVAERYAAFLEAVASGEEWVEDAPADSAAPLAAAPPQKVEIPPEYILGWAEAAGSRPYAEQHITRFGKTLELTPPGTANDRILEMGAYMQITPALKTKLGYGEVRGCYFGPLGKTEHKQATSPTGETFECVVDLFNAEKDVFPYPDGHFATVLCCELIEHLATDPMHLMSEINRILRVGGHLVLTTPNASSLRAIAAILQGYHPGFFPAYLKPSEDGNVDPRHAREYAARELGDLLRDSGFDVVTLDTGPFLDEPKPELAWINHLLDRYLLDTNLRGDGIYAVGKKNGPVRERYPAWLYS